MKIKRRSYFMTFLKGPSRKFLLGTFDFIYDDNRGI